MKASLTPMMKQWYECKEQAKEALLLFRLGDFYEAFYEDAKILSQELELTLTKRGDVPMSGIPAHTIDNYLEKLIQKGHLVAIAEQTQDPKDAKGLVKREVTKLLSPGCVYLPGLLKEKAYNFFASVLCHRKSSSLSFVDLTTGAFHYFEHHNRKELFDELIKLSPSELLVPKNIKSLWPDFIQEIQQSLPTKVTIKENFHFDFELCEPYLKNHFRLLSLDGLGLKEAPLSICSSGALLAHLKEDLYQSIDHIQSLKPFQTGTYMSLDRITQKNLDIFTSSDSKTLFDLVDHTSTPMGGRLLRMWITHPLICPKNIQNRLTATQVLMNHDQFDFLSENIKTIKDLERLITRIITANHSPKDLGTLKLSLDPIEKIKEKLKLLSHPFFQKVLSLLQDTQKLCTLINTTLTDNPPLKLITGQLIKKGVDERLDHLKTLKENAEEFLLQYQTKLREETQIKTLKVGFNKAFGYFIEVSRAQSKHVPSGFYKRQTLTNNERYITDELQKFEQDILQAEEEISKIEQKIYQDLRTVVLSYEKPIRSTAQGIAQLDCLIAFAKLAKTPHYTAPLVDDSDILCIQEGRHPIVEQSHLSPHFIPNDTLINQDERLLLITGPNMAGKSTYIRQVALIVMMAQIGLYVPASFAHIGVVDKIFTRIGASDDLFRGQSTFMVEMSETANILNHATNKSLVILDEIGRGTSTYDGISIARAVAEFLLTHPKKRAKTLFATHYFELTDLEKELKGAVNYNIAVEEGSDKIIFLRKIERGAADKSYGIHVAKLAGLPPSVIS